MFDFNQCNDAIQACTCPSNDHPVLPMNIPIESARSSDVPHFRGWFRAQLAGQGRSLSDAIEVAEHRPTMGINVHHAARDLFGIRCELSANEGEGFFGLVRVRDEMLVTTGEFSYRDERVELAGGDDLIQFCFNLSGDMRLQLPGDRLVHLRRPVLLVYRHLRGVTLPHATPPGARERVVSVNISADSLARLLGSESKITPSLFPMIDPVRSTLIPTALLPMTPAMFDLSRALIANRMTDALGLVQMDSLATQLLCVALESMAEERTDCAGRLQASVPLAIGKARDLLRRDLQAAWTLQSVARSVGICETRLKRDFKKFYGETLGSYSTRIRMEHALALLQRGGTSITRVALAVGYRHPTSFAKAFGRHFGVSPRAGRL